MTTIGFMGSGHVGSTLARIAVGRGHQVVLSNSRGPETLAELVALLGPNARAATPAEAAGAAELAVVSIPLKNYRDVPAGPLAGKIVIDTNNYYPERDGIIEELERESTTTAELLQAHLPASRVVKAFSHLTFSDLAEQGQTAGTPGRRALALAGDDAEARRTVAELINDFGFDPVDAGPLAEGWRFQRDTPAYLPRLDRDELRAALASARRYAEAR
jgi:predicted dinucleotide-binding enzyme